MPVPAPAETKTTPGASIAACCSGFGAFDRAHARLTRHIGQSSHQVGQEPPVGSCCTSPVADALDDACGVLARALDPAPERVLVEVVVLLKPGRPSSRASARSSPRASRVAGERAVEAAERLDPDEVAQHEHVERDLQLQLALDLPRRVRARPDL